MVAGEEDCQDSVRQSGREQTSGFHSSGNQSTSPESILEWENSSERDSSGWIKLGESWPREKASRVELSQKKSNG